MKRKGLINKCIYEYVCAQRIHSSKNMSTTEICEVGVKLDCGMT